MRLEREPAVERKGFFKFLPKMNSERWKSALSIALPIIVAAGGAGIAIANGLAGNFKEGMMTLIAGLGAGYFLHKAMTSPKESRL